MRNGNTGATQVSYKKELIVLTTLFFMWGFLTSLNDILIPHLKAIFSLNYTEAMLVQFVFFAAYFLVSLPSSAIIEKVGYKKGIIFGLLLAGVGTLLFYPAASMRIYILFLLALFIMASGITILQVAANPYVSVLGKPETASSRLNLTQAFNSLGTTIGPVFGSVLILSVAVKSVDELALMSVSDIEAYKLAEAASVQLPYIGLTAALVLLAFIISFFKLPEINESEIESMEGGVNGDILTGSVWKIKHLILGAVAIFVYVGAEVSIGSFLVNFLGESNIGGLSEVEAGTYVSLYWGGAMVGRFIGSALLQKIKPGKLLAINSFGAVVLVFITIVTSGYVAMASILAVGLMNSIMFPTIFTLGVNSLKNYTKKGSGILIMAIVGGALIPLLQGVLADSFGIQLAFILPLVCYLYIAYYGMIGSKVRL